MVNLLPVSEKVKIQNTYKSRLLIVGLIFFVITVGFGVVALSPALLWGFVKEKVALDRLTVVSEIVSVEERKNLKKSVSDTNKKISLLQEEKSGYIFIYEAIEKTMARKNFNVTLTAFFYENIPGSSQGVRMTVSGVAKDRQTLLAFVNALEKEPVFTNVELPVSNFVKSSDIPFSVSLQFNNDEDGK
ncbi:MAG: hypothetical protein HYT93_02085 [Parcubacteria group bacterium]|nr:hypothetical protein [Parcubacteria group bacterium]